MIFRPLLGRVLVKPDVRPDQTPSGLHVVDHWPIETTGTVVAIGAVRCARCDGAADPGFAVDEVVVFSGSAGQEFRLPDDDTRYLLLRHEDVLAVLEGV